MAIQQDYKEVIKALRVIRDECANHETDCLGCPLETEDGKCGITGESSNSFEGDYKKKPKYWKLTKIRLLQPKND